jgi:hypothetical protein
MAVSMWIRGASALACAAIVGCGSESAAGPSDEDTGGSDAVGSGTGGLPSGSGGAPTGTGGSVRGPDAGVGGTKGTGGASGTGGAKGTGGAAGTGGEKGTGGTTGTGGASGTGGAGGSGRPIGDGACPNQSGATVTVCNIKQGITIKYAGVNDQNEVPALSAPNLALAGINVVRDFGNYIRTGTPFEGLTIDQVKANPDVIDWTAAGNYFGSKKRDWLTWAKNTQGIFLYGLLWARNKQAVSSCASGEMTFRVGNADDENLMWVIVFGYAYWANVKNGLAATHLELSNEPDNCGGNGTTQVNQAGQNRIIQLGKDAMTYVNQTSGKVSPPLPAVIVGPGVLTESTGWVSSALSDTATRAALDAVSWHTYWDQHWFQQVQDSAWDVNNRTGGTKKQWITEWGQWWYAQGYSDATVVHGMSAVIPKMGLWNIEVNMPWALTQEGTLTNGLVQAGTKTRLFWEIKMLNRALLSEKDYLETSFTNVQGDTNYAYATQDATDLYVILMNNGGAATLAVDVTQIPKTQNAAVELFSVGTSGETAEPATAVSGGRLTVAAAADTHYVARIRGAGYP